MKAQIIQGNVFEVLPTLPPGSIDCAVFSPPYWMLRSYLPKDHALKHLELGSEPTIAEYIANQVHVLRLVREALADHGTVWLNVGDTYSADWPCQRRNVIGNGALEDGTRKNRPSRSAGLVDGSRCLVPERLTIALQDDGWIVRSVIVWHKPAPMPASMSGWSWRRCRVKVQAGNQTGSGKQSENRLTAGLNERTQPARSERNPGKPNSDHNGHDFAAHAQWLDCPGCKKCSLHGGFVLRRGSWRPTSSWEPILMLAKTARYYADGEAVKQPPAAATVSRDQYTRVIDDPEEQFAVRHDHETECVDGANLRDVWTIAAEPLKEKHYAAFPTALVERCLRAGTSAKGYCPACGAPWCRVIRSEFVPQGDVSAKRGVKGAAGQKAMDKSSGWDGTPRGSTRAETLDWRPSCRCPTHEPRPGRVLDPFAGSGRTGVAARRLGLDFVGIDLNPDYCAMSRRLLNEQMPLFTDVATLAADGPELFS